MRILTGIALALLVVGCKTEAPKEATADMIFFDEKDTSKLPKLTVEKPHLEFGKVIDGDHVEHTYILKNDGKAPLLISEVVPSCGCTTPKKWTRTPIAPGETTELVIDFNSTGKVGKIDKSISVYNNGQPPVVMLTIAGEVVALDTK